MRWPESTKRAASSAVASTSGWTRVGITAPRVVAGRPWAGRRPGDPACPAVACCGMGRPTLALAVALGAILVAPVRAEAAPADPAVAAGGGAAPSHSGPALTFESQTPWVGPGQPMRITFRVGSGDVSSLSLNIAVYNCLTSRSAMAVTVNGGAVGVIESETTVPVSSLSPDGGGDVNL